MKLAGLEDAPHLCLALAGRIGGGLDVQCVRMVSALLREGDVGPTDIPNIILRGVYGDYLNIYLLNCEPLNKCFDEQRAVAASDFERNSRYSGSGRGAGARIRFALLQRGRVGSREGHV